MCTEFEELYLGFDGELQLYWDMPRSFYLGCERVERRKCESSTDRIQLRCPYVQL